MTTAEAVYAVGPDVGCVQDDYGGDLFCYVAVLPDGPPLVLRGSAATVWAAASQGGSSEAIVARVAKQVGVAEADVEADVLGFLHDLVARGVLQRDNRSGRRGVDESAKQVVTPD